ncbi:MAG: DinB family protein [Candidatus Hydrogenedentales bacterium]|jgi:uncharacterized damage-inducible protein DinB
MHPNAAELHQGSTPDYVSKMLASLSARDPIDVMKCTGDALAEACKRMDETALRTPEASGKWSVLDVVQHLADGELVLGFRYRRILGEPESSPLPPFDPSAWATRLRYSEVNLGAALDQFNAVRRINLQFLEGLRDADWDVRYTHFDRGKETLRDAVRLYAAHDLCHLAQIGRIKQRVIA